MEYRIEFCKDNIFRVIRTTYGDLNFLQDDKHEEVFRGSVSECKDFIEMSRKGLIKN